jgi:hypothetical protein
MGHVTLHEINIALKAMLPLSAPGHDGFPAIVFKEASVRLRKVIQKLVQRCFEVSHFSKILKRGKTSFRLIDDICTLCKKEKEPLDTFWGIATWPWEKPKVHSTESHGGMTKFYTPQGRKRWNIRNLS